MKTPSRLFIATEHKAELDHSRLWQSQAIEKLSPYFDDVMFLGMDSGDVNGYRRIGFNNEIVQIEQFLRLNFTHKDIFLHCNLTTPGLFHNTLFHHKPRKSAVFCHETAADRYSEYSKVRAKKFKIEKTHADLYSLVLFSSKYHHDKCNFKNGQVLGSLPAPPLAILPEKSLEPRTIFFASVTPKHFQKSDAEVERAVDEWTGHKVQRKKHLTWKGYYQFLDRSKFLLVTAKESNYPYDVLDAIERGCIPIAPRAYCYPEILPDALLYNPHGSPQDKAQQISYIVDMCEEGAIKNLVPKNQDKIQNFWINLAGALQGIGK